MLHKSTKMKYLLSLILLLFACQNRPSELANNIINAQEPSSFKTEKTVNSSKKINGISFVSPPRKFDAAKMQDVVDINANWLAVSPFAFSRKGKPKVIFGTMGQWWGESPKGAQAIASYAHSAGLKVMIKPQVWMPDDWAGTYDLQEENKWQEWEKSYEKYILTFAEIAAETKAELFCIGTEYKIAAVQREQFWRELIQKIRKTYTGKLTYAANWDHFQNIPFWDALDYIGIDAYFPLLDMKTPDIDQLKAAWQTPLQEIEKVQTKFDKPVLFTEYGYLCVDGAAWRVWENEANIHQLLRNETAQNHAFQALYESIWHKDWFAGGFLWKWFINPNYDDQPYEKGYDPKGKKCAATIRYYYGKY